MLRLHRALTVALASCLLAAPASAQLVSFSFSGGLTASWTLPQSPAPDFSNSEFFALDDVDILYEGAPQTVGLEFYTPELGGGVCIGAATFCDLGNLFGTPLFTGDVSSPAFMTGIFSLIDDRSGDDVRLVIERVSDVPEPSTLLLLGMGTAGLFAVRRRQNVHSV